MTKRTFSLPPVEKLPPLLCRGVVDSNFEDAKLTQSENYYIIKLKFTGIHGSRDGYGNFMFRPEWFSSAFQVSEYTTAAEDAKQAGEEDTAKQMRALTFVYKKNIVDRKGVSVLQALAGSHEKFEELVDRLIVDEDEADPAVISQTIRDFLREHEGEPVGFILEQRTEEQEDGTRTLVEGRYETTGFFYADDNDTIEYLKKGGRRRGPALVSWDESIPF